ncbi:MAG: IS200/IS605 family transposase [Victivallaceae bacterium]
MRKSGTLTHTMWECKYHVVFIPKCRKKVLYGTLCKYLGTVFKDLAQQRESEIEEGHLRPDHVHMLLSVPPKYSVSEVVGFIKGKNAIYVARNFMSHRKNYGGQNFWARGYYVSTVGRDEKTIRQYIQDQEKEDIKFEQGDLFR